MNRESIEVLTELKAMTDYMEAELSNWAILMGSEQEAQQLHSCMLEVISVGDALQKRMNDLERQGK
jgi:hypothetical protein